MTTITYSSIMTQIQKLISHAEKLHESELVILDVKEKVKAYNLTAVDLGLVEKIIHTRRKPEVKFLNQTTGESWTGRGKLPKWIKNSGKAKEEFLIS